MDEARGDKTTHQIVQDTVTSRAHRKSSIKLLGGLFIFAVLEGGLKERGIIREGGLFTVKSAIKML